MDMMFLAQRIRLTRHFYDHRKLRVFDLNGIDHFHESFLKGLIRLLLISRNRLSFPVLLLSQKSLNQKS